MLDWLMWFIFDEDHPKAKSTHSVQLKPTYIRLSNTTEYKYYKMRSKKFHGLCGFKWVYCKHAYSYVVEVSNGHPVRWDTVPLPDFAIEVSKEEYEKNVQV